MPLQIHELHPTLVHAPLVLLPAAAGVDLAAVSARGRLRRFALDAAGRRLWWVAVGSAALAGAAGMAASQEVHLEDPAARDAMWLHGMGNTCILLAGVGLAAWRSGHRATAASAAMGAAAVGAAVYTAWLGGELVYTHGAGVKRMGAADSPPLFSARGPARLLADAGRGLAWLMGRAGRLAARKEPL
ncbi:MAG TPA: DUF2231 domain-containing protein, partial [Anaeromyxobacteraceae bacterium]|nr:DUF2231 domain-containing protein [Anaeromyxobacteraceae bacterium]